MKKSNILILFAGLFLIIGMISSVNAITGSIGNARMILRDVQTGDTIEKYILVKNVNDVPVDIELFVSGDLEDDIKIKDNNFRLNAGEEKKAYFTIDVAKEGTSETKINVKFSPIDRGNGVGLSSTIIIMAEKGPGFLDGLLGSDSNGNQSSDSNLNENAVKNSSSLVIGLLITAFIFLILVILLFFLSKKKRNLERIQHRDSEYKLKYNLKKIKK